MPKLTVGLVGPKVSGMWKVSKALDELGFMGFSLSEAVREKASGFAANREAWGNVANDWRRIHGASFFARITAPLIWTANPEFAYVDSLRNDFEVEYLKNWFNALIIGVDAPGEARLALAPGRGRNIDETDLQKFLESDEIERGKGQPWYGLQIDKALAKAHVVIRYDGKIEVLEEKVETELVPQIKRLMTGERTLR